MYLAIILVINVQGPLKNHQLLLVNMMLLLYTWMLGCWVIRMLVCWYVRMRMVAVACGDVDMPHLPHTLNRNMLL
jgi:hypothetical protein